MRLKHGWLIALLLALVVACGPQMATPTPPQGEETEPVATTAPSGETPAAATAPSVDTPVAEPLSYADLVDAGDWHALGPADASVTIVEYSDFQ